MDGPPALPAPTNGQPQRQKKSGSTARNNQQQWRRKSQHNSNNNKHRIPSQQQKSFKRRGNGKRVGQTELGFFGSVPSLQDLQRENRKKTRRYYGNNNQQRGAFPGSSHVSILTKPPPPYFPRYLSNDTIDTIQIDNNKPKIPWLSPTGRFLAPPAAPTPARFPGAELANPLATPTLAANQDGAADKLEAEGLHAGLDFFATNDGLVLYNDTPAPSSWTEDENENDGEMDSHSLSGSEDDDHEGDEDGENEHRKRARLLRKPAGSTLAGNGFGSGGVASGSAHARIIQRLRDRVAQQDAYIAELEDDNLQYKERLDLLKHQLREIQEESGGGGPEPTTAAPVAAKVTIMNGNEKDRVDDGSEMNESPALKV
jgi:hypothetical protein